MGEHRAALLGKARHVDQAAALFLDMGGHAEDLADGDDAGAADAGDDGGPAVIERGDGRRWQCGEEAVEAAGVLGFRFGLAQLAAMDGDEGGTEALDAGEVLVAARLVHLALAAEGGFDGWMETQLDFTPQSPQPSQTASLMKARLFGSGKVPRLRRRRFSAAQVWS